MTATSIKFKHFKRNIFICVYIFSIINAALFAQENSNIITKKNLENQINYAFNDLELYDSDNKAFEICSFIKKNKINLKNRRLKGLINYFNGHIAIYQRQFDLSENYTHEALSLFLEINDKVLIALCYNNIAVARSSRGETKNVEEYKYKAVSILEASHEKKYLIDIYFNLSRRETLPNKNLESIKNGKRAIHLIDSLGIKKTRLKFLYNVIAYNQIMLGKYSEAEFNLQEALRLNKQTFKLNNKKGGRLIASIYREFGLLYAKTGKYQQSINNYELALETQILNINTQNKAQNEKANREYKLQQELEVNKKQVLKQHKLLVYLSVGFFIVSVWYGFKIFKLYKKLQESSIKIKELNNELLHTNLNLKERKDQIELLLSLNQRALFSKVLKISTYNDSITKIGDTISKLIETQSEIKINQLHHIEKSLLSLISEDELWEDFKIQFENTHPDFFSKLIRISSDLTINDLKHCSYIVSKLNTKEVAILINISPRSVETTRYRLKKKLDLSKENNLYNFLQNL